MLRQDRHDYLEHVRDVTIVIFDTVRQPGLTSFWDGGEGHLCQAEGFCDLSDLVAVCHRCAFHLFLHVGFLGSSVVLVFLVFARV